MAGPKYPGLDTHRRALEAGDRESGATVHFVIPELDAVIVLTRQPYGQRGMHQQSIRLMENYVLASMACEA